MHEQEQHRTAVLGEKRAAIEPLQAPEQMHKRQQLLQLKGLLAAHDHHVAAAQNSASASKGLQNQHLQPRQMDWALERMMREGVAGTVPHLPQPGSTQHMQMDQSSAGLPPSVCLSTDEPGTLANPFSVVTTPSPLPAPQLFNKAPPPLRLPRLVVAQAEGPQPQQPGAMLCRANSVPPAAEPGWTQEAGACAGFGSSGMFKARSVPLPERAGVRVRVNRRNIVKRLAELGTSQVRGGRACSKRDCQECWRPLP